VSVAILLGGATFFMLNSERSRTQGAPLTAPSDTPARISLDGVPPPPDLLQPQAVAPAPEQAEARDRATPAPATVQPSAPPTPAPDPAIRWKSPALVVDLGSAEAAATPPVTPGAGGGREENLTAEERFAQRVATAEVARARAIPMPAPELTVPEGTIIPAVLETAINSDLPGFTRAVVSRDVLSFDGETVLAPRGSKLIGQYRSGVAAGQSRAFVIWTRLIRPDGASVQIASPGSDTLGRGGLEGTTDSHFFRRFGGAILLSVISAGLGALNDDDGAQIIISSSQDASRVAEIALQKQIDIPPTIEVPQGAPIRVFVTRDLDFSLVGASTP
jgi:type IV secretion system protein VirB10